MQTSMPLPVRAATAAIRKSRLRRFQFSVLFEGIACGVLGNRIEGAAYRQGARLNVEARCYQFRDPKNNGQGVLVYPALQEPSICTVVRRRLRDLLSQADIDLLYLRYCAGWSQAALAEELGCCRSTVKRRE